MRRKPVSIYKKQNCDSGQDLLLMGRNGYTALVIIEAIQVYRILAGRGARAGENDVDNQ